MLKMIMAPLIIIAILLLTFYGLGKKEKWDSLVMSTFECGFNSYFFSRFSFSIHYFSIALIFLFLDLELCFMMPFFNESMNSQKMSILSFIFMSVLLVGLILEWKEGKLTWYF